MNKRLVAILSGIALLLVAGIVFLFHSLYSVNEENDGEYDDEYEGYDEENEDSDVDNGFEELNDVMSGILDFLNKLGSRLGNLARLGSVGKSANIAIA